MALMFIGEQEDAQQALNILRKMTSTNPAIKQYTETQENHDSWLKWHGVNETDSVGANALLASRLLQSENFATAEARTELAKAIYAANFGQYHLVAGKGVQEGDPNGETSVTPAWRKTVAHLESVGIPSANPDKYEWYLNACAASV